MSLVKVDSSVQQTLASRGVTEKTGIFGEHKVQLGKKEPIRLDSIKSNKIPFQGFTTATKVIRGKAGLTASAAKTLEILRQPGTLDARALLAALKTSQNYMIRLEKLGRLTDRQKQDALWAFAPAVENLSNQELAAAYQSFTTADMDLLQTALLREGTINPEARDARAAAALLFDLQALVLKEVSNRAARGMAADLAAKNPDERELMELHLPPRLSEQYGAEQPPLTPGHTHDITTANLRTLVETAAQSATTREKTARQEAERLQRRELPSVSVKEMADVLRSAELTININTDLLLTNPTLLTHPDAPMKNIFHLAAEHNLPKGEGYLARRDATERLLFPELEGHEVRADERPVYGALNLQQRSTGATAATAGYGNSAIVLKPEVARRATYIANDTFYAPVVHMDQRRRENFYALLDGANLPAAFTTACRDIHSPEHKALEAWFDNIARLPEAHTDAFRHLPPGLDLNGEDFGRLVALLTQCFGDATATRNLMATHDNLEALIPHMSDFNGNALAQAAMAREAGDTPAVCLGGIQYIEAQIQGPLVPSRDIAEIRIDLNEVEPEQRAALRTRMEAFSRQTNIPVVFVAGRGAEAESISSTRRLQEEKTFHVQHLDRQKVEEETTALLNDLQGRVTEQVAANPDLVTGLPGGQMHIDEHLLEELTAAVRTQVEKDLAAPSQVMKNPTDLVRHAFETAATPLLEKASALQREQALLRSLQELPLETPAQKQALAEWIQGSAPLRTPEELRLVHEHASALSSLLMRIAEAVPPLSAADILRETGKLEKNISAAVRAFAAEHGEPVNVSARIAQMAQLLLEGLVPAPEEYRARLSERLNGPHMRALLGQLGAILSDPNARRADEGLLDLSVLLRSCAEVAVKSTGKSYETPSFPGALSLIPKDTRDLLEELAPKTAAVLNQTHPGYPPFPAPADAKAMPADGAARRNFLVAHMDAYLEHERTVPFGYVHGRGHIARAFIFASALCSILEKHGVFMDRNAVLCGITGHDVGRKAAGEDMWEEESAHATVAFMQKDFGPDTMGEAYEQAVKEAIAAHDGHTLEGALLHAADSLDIGRTKPFDPAFFTFLRGRNGEKPGPEAEAIRRQLAVEADLLQRLTDPYCQTHNIREKLAQLINEERNRELNDTYTRQWKELQQQTTERFEKLRNIPAEDFLADMENLISENPELFPLLSRYYRP